MNRIPDYRLADVFFPGDLPREELLSLPVSITSWIILREYAETHADCAVFRKILTDYWAAAPLWEMVRVIDLASFNLKASEFEWLTYSSLMTQKDDVCRMKKFTERRQKWLKYSLTTTPWEPDSTATSIPTPLLQMEASRRKNSAVMQSAAASVPWPSPTIT